MYFTHLPCTDVPSVLPSQGQAKNTGFKFSSGYGQSSKAERGLGAGESSMKIAWAEMKEP